MAIGVAGEQKRDAVWREVTLGQGHTLSHRKEVWK